MPRAECSCDAAWFERHRPGCPRRNDTTAAEAIRAALLRRHAFDTGEWVAWPEAFRIDVFAMRFWESGIGPVRVAYEIKVSRADFLSEVRNPEKRRLAMEISNEFFFATPKGLLNPKEIPSGCGLIELVGEQMRIKLRGPSRQPRWFTESEVRGLLRMDLFRSGSDRLKVRLQTAEARVEELGRQMDQNRVELKDAERVLDKHLGHLLIPGSLWRGPWSRAWWERRAPLEEVVVEVVESTRSSVWVEFRRTDSDRDEWRSKDSLPRGEFLRRYEQVQAA